MIDEVIDIQKEIVSSEDIGNINYDFSLADFEKDIKESQRYSDGRIVLKSSSMSSLVYEYMNALALEFDIFTGELRRIIATGGYKAGLYNKVFVGQKVRELLKFDNSFEPYATGGLMSPNHLGICVYINDRFDLDIHDIELVLDYEITGIGIIKQYDTEGKDLYLTIYGLEHPKYKNT